MADLIFTVHTELDDEAREELLRLILDMPGVERAVPLKLHSKSEEVRRTYFARLGDESNVAAIRRRIRRLAQVEAVHTQPIRTAKVSG
jgi:hypothetical protein